MAFGLQWSQFFTLLPLGAAALTCINQTYKVYVSEKKHGRSFIHAFGECGSCQTSNSTTS